MAKQQGISDAEHVAHGGGICPFCGSGDEYLEGDEINIDSGQATQGISCCFCGAEWLDCYSLVGYLTLERK